jgi:uncharacterized protein (TIGR00255 family)
MTGFGRGEAGGGALVVTAEARSVNSRHLDLVVRLPRAAAALEPDVRRLVQGRLERGRVEVSVQAAPAPGLTTAHVVVDPALARAYLAEARALGTTLGLDEAVPLRWVLERPGVLRLEDGEPAGAEVPWPLVADALGRALDELVARRTSEGEALAEELRRLHAELAARVEAMAGRAPAAVERRAARLRERLQAWLAEGGVDEQRIATEIAVWADRTDVSEELTRLRAHLGELAARLDGGGPVGRALDFLLQELHREVNTVASKADDLELSQTALAAKGLLEKIREQAQNLE